MRFWLGKGLELLGIACCVMALATGLVEGEMRGVAGAMGRELTLLFIGISVFFAGWLVERGSG